MTDKELVFEWVDMPENTDGKKKNGKRLKIDAPTSWSGKVEQFSNTCDTSPTACFNNKYMATVRNVISSNLSSNDKHFHGLFDTMIEGQMFVERHMIGVLEFERAAARTRLAMYDEILKKHDSRKDGAK